MKYSDIINDETTERMYAVLTLIAANKLPENEELQWVAAVDKDGTPYALMGVGTYDLVTNTTNYRPLIALMTPEIANKLTPIFPTLEELKEAEDNAGP